MSPTAWPSIALKNSKVGVLQECNTCLAVWAQDGKAEAKETLMSLLLNNVLKNPYIWGMALTYFFIYVVRQGVTSWFVFYLIKVCPFITSCFKQAYYSCQ